MTTKPSSNPPADEPTDEKTAETKPAFGSVVRLDDPALDGDPQYALVVGDGLVSRLAVQRHELPTHKA